MAKPRKVNIKVTKEEAKIKVVRDDPLNLTAHFDDRELKALGQKGFQLYQEDDESRSKWLEVHREYLEIYHQIDNYDNNFSNDFNSSDARIPLLTESCLGFQARASKAIFPQRDFVSTTSMVDITPEEEQRVDRVAKWLNYDLNFVQRRYKRDKKRMLLAASLMGSDFTKTYPDRDGMPKVERIRAQDFIVCYGTGPRELEDVRRKTHRITMDLNKAKKLYRDGFFSSLPLESGIDYDENNDLQDVENEAEGMTRISNEGKSALILEQHTWYDLDGDGIEEPCIFWIDGTSQKVLRVAARYDVNDEEKKPIEYFTHYPFLDNTDGFYGYGYGHLIAKLNQSLNQMLRNSLDAGELANSGNMGGFISENVGVKGGEIEMAIGKFTKIPRSVDDINKAIYQMKFPGPNAAYVNLMEFMQGIIQRLANTTEAVSGDASKVYQPMTILTMLEQSLQMPSSIMENIALAMEGELEKILDVARRNAPAIQTFTTDDKRISITKEDFQGAMRVYPIMDPRTVTKQQKMAQAQSVYQLATTNPLIAQKPEALYQATKDVLVSMEVKDIDRILPPLENQKPEKIDDQYEENMFFLMPPQDKPLFDVFPNQDHAKHIQIINELLAGFQQQKQTTGQMDINPQQLQAIMDHKQKHVAFLYAQHHGVIDGQGQLATMDAQTGDPAFLAALEQQFHLGGQPAILPTGQSGEVPGTGGGFEGSGEIPGEGVLERVPLDTRNTGVHQ
jgi:hypothetical protein